ncbi:MAG: hypothetical protein R3C49_05235 [Planctomycetaceae bacterium]
MTGGEQDNPYQAPLAELPPVVDGQPVLRPHPLALAMLVAAAVVASGATFFFTCAGAFFISPFFIVLLVLGTPLVYVLMLRFGIPVLTRLRHRFSGHPQTTPATLSGGRLTAAAVLSFVGVIAATICSVICFDNFGDNSASMISLILASAAGTLIVWAMLPVSAPASTSSDVTSFSREPSADRPPSDSPESDPWT